MNPYVRNQFGFSVGGPIIKNKTFFFFNDELDRFRTTLTNQATVPTAAFKSGVFNYTYIDPNTGQSNTIPVDLTATGANNAFGIPADPTMQKVFALYPTPTSASANGIEGNLFYPSTSATKFLYPDRQDRPSLYRSRIAEHALRVRPLFRSQSGSFRLPAGWNRCLSKRRPSTRAYPRN